MPEATVLMAQTATIPAAESGCHQPNLCPTGTKPITLARRRGEIIARDEGCADLIIVIGGKSTQQQDAG
ncbi:MAG: hypothetical protein ACUVX8_07735 [Candidatus Zipacnadales bacterium]